MISPTLWHLYDLYINHIVIYQEVLSIDIRGVAGLGRRSWPEAEGTLAAAFRTQLGSGISPPNIGDFTNKNGDFPHHVAGGYHPLISKKYYGINGGLMGV